MNLKRSYILFFALAIAVSGNPMRAAEEKQEGRLKRAMNALRADKGVKVCAAVGAVVFVASLYYVLAKDTDFEPVFVNPNNLAASPEIKNQYHKVGVVFIKMTDLSASTIVHLNELEKSGKIKKSSIAPGAYDIKDSWFILDEIAVSNAKIGPFSRLAGDLEKILAPLKKTK
jgi:hypothetical protein